MPNQELSLVPAESSSQQFSTKGSLDWVGLGRMQFSASVAVLGRLAAAGVEPLTVAVGQAMCSRIPLGVHGEKVLMEAMGKLKAFSSAGDLIWFGVGVRHILRTLVQTSQGASLVALCAALAESHSIPTAALMILEISKVLGSPDELRPSFAQWQALVKVCSSVLTVTTFGVRLQQLLDLCGADLNHGRDPLAPADYFYDREDQLFAPDYGAQAYPPDFAEAVIAVGKVSSGALQDVELTGGASCAWLAVFAEYILGLRVQVRKDSGQLLTMNHSTDLRSQVVVVFCRSSTERSALRCTGQSYTISSGAEFIRHFFEGREGDRDHKPDWDGTVPWRSVPLRRNHKPVWGGRVLWQSMLHDVFGDVVDDLLQPVEKPAKKRLWGLIAGSTVNRDYLRQEAFLTLIVYAAEVIVSETPAFGNYDTFSLLQHMLTKLLELSPIQDQLLQKNHELQQLLDAESRLFPSPPINCFGKAKEALALYCGCSYHTSGPRNRVYCIVAITELIIVLTSMLEHLDLDSPILPLKRGIMLLYRQIHWNGIKRGVTDFIFGSWVVGHQNHSTNERLELYHSLFSGARTKLASVSLRDEPKYPVFISALSDGAIYCYMDTVVNMTNKVEQAYRIHVGAGTINAGSKHRDFIQDESYCSKERGPIAKRHVFDENDGNLFSDTTSPSLRMKPIINEGVNISFWYELSNEIFSTQVFPATLAKHLFESSRHRVVARYSAIERGFPSRLIKNKQLRLIGEGNPLVLRDDVGTYNIIIRPHHGNLLGRIVSLIHAGKVTSFLVDNKEDLTRAKSWIRMKNKPAGEVVCFVS